MKPKGAIVPVAWMEGAWILSSQPEQHLRFWVEDGRVWGPDGAADTDTGYWVADGWIWGPVGAADPDTGFYIAENWIYGPAFRLPFA